MPRNLPPFIWLFIVTGMLTEFVPVQYLYRRLQVNNPWWQIVMMTVLRYNYRKDHFLVRVQLSTVCNCHVKNLT